MPSQAQTRAEVAMSMDALIPNPMDSLQQYLRHWHFDVSQLDDEELSDELHALRPLLWGLPPKHWLRKRVRFLQGEMNHRKYSGKYSKDKRPVPKLAEGVKL